MVNETPPLDSASYECSFKIFSNERANLPTDWVNPLVEEVIQYLSELTLLSRPVDPIALSYDTLPDFVLYC
ncbi:hypothetical protein OE810_02315 [Rhodobacteraceae bacterium XHP0102]|nr:hypothetical protein [Rhodobacteraceae bacterium XHP0102]